MRIKTQNMTVKKFVQKYWALEKYDLIPVHIKSGWKEDFNHLVWDLNPSTGINHYIKEERISLITVKF